MSDAISTILTVLLISILLLSIFTTMTQMVKINNLQEMAQLVGRQIANTGKVDGATQYKFGQLQQQYNMAVTMTVDGTYINGTTLMIETPFTVTLSYNTRYGIGGNVNSWFNKTYKAKAEGMVEEYTK